MLGHSERRQHFGETDKALQEKVPAALEHGLEPILCVGESEEERENDETQRRLRHQVQEALEKVPDERLADVVIAYEPIWAIGTGKVATAEIAQDACGFIRALVGDRSEDAAAARARALRRQRQARQRGRAARPDRHRRRARRRREPGPRRASPRSSPPRDERRSGPDAGPGGRLVILDGWGLAPDGPGNAISLADTPTFDRLWDEHPHTELTAKGRAVGLPEGQMGNSEVGHLNLGAGAVVKQDLTRIDDAVEDGSFAANEVLRAAMDAPRVHLIGLVSDGGVHASMDHLRALIEMAGDKAIVHAFTDGRDTLPTSGAGYLETVQGWLRESGGRIGTVGGRYWGMDRDKRWDRTQKAYDAIVKGEGPHADDAVAAVKASYEDDVTDEFVEPTVIGDDTQVRDGDSVVFFNFRPDRARQMTELLTARRRAGHAVHLPDRVQRGLGPAGRVPARAARR